MVNAVRYTPYEELLSMQEQRLKTNLDTNLIKLIAIISMTVDHVGGAFFPEYPVFRWIGRIAFRFSAIA